MWKVKGSGIKKEVSTCPKKSNVVHVGNQSSKKYVDETVVNAGFYSCVSDSSAQNSSGQL